MDDHDELLARFRNVVPIDESKALFYLEANNWDLQTALSNFYEEGAGEQDLEEEMFESEPSIMPGNFPSSSAVASSSSAVAASSSSSGQKIGKGTSTERRVATLRDFTGHSAEEEAEDDEEHENLFAGGEKSGIFTQNPSVKASSLVGDILRKAAEGGRAAAEDDVAKPTKPSYFGGTGYRLGSEDEPSVVIPSSAGSGSHEPEELQPVVRHLTFWRNGFSIEDGPLMAYDDPANKEFLQAINSGRAPLQLLNVKTGQPVDMRVARRLDEDYKPPPKKPSAPFSGSGQRLGSLVTAVATSSSASSSASSASPTQRPTEFQVDESLPTTSIQVRLGDGTRMVARFNHTHTIGDIRNFINASRAGEASRDYTLQTTFPTKELTDESQTLTDASLLNSVVVQRYI
ncbi:414_t:CDS:10 [Paraglomus occultum]|uniref:414_t:CDS:1 n=1 Tax=Paraglomus occultum TaxID=144539 RepID=A0A9N9AR66_9GLOM|nr:414_t:CDS:10 [Paraglomus occultum]